MFEHPQTQIEDIERTQSCTEYFQKMLSNKNIYFLRSKNQFTIRVPKQQYAIDLTIAVHCPRNDKDNPNYNPGWIYVSKKTYEEHPADFYIGYNPHTLEADGFAKRPELKFVKCKRRVWLYGIQRESLDPNIDLLLTKNLINSIPIYHPNIIDFV